MYESEGTRAQATVSLDPALARGGVTVVDLLERPFGQGAPAFRSAVERDEDGGAALLFRPFEIKTLRISRARCRLRRPLRGRIWNDQGHRGPEPAGPDRPITWSSRAMTSSPPSDTDPAGT